MVQRQLFEKYRAKREAGTRDFFEHGHLRLDKTLKAGRPAIRRDCNLECIFCHEDQFVGRTGRVAATNDFFVEKTRLLSDITSKKMEVHFAGNGEPLVTGSELVELVDRFSKMEEIKKVKLTTNGLLLGRMAVDLYNAGLASANVSICSLNQDEYKMLTRVNGLEEVLYGIEVAVKSGMNVKINCPVTQTLAIRIGEYLKLSKNLGTALKLFPLIDTKDTEKLFQELKTRMIGQSTERYDYSYPYEGTVLLVDGAVVDIKDTNLNHCKNQGCTVRARCMGGCRYHIRLGVDGVLQPCPSVKTTNLVDLTDPTVTREQITEALREGGKL